MKRVALICCCIGVIGLMFLGAYQQPEKIDISTVAAIAH